MGLMYGCIAVGCSIWSTSVLLRRGLLYGCMLQYMEYICTNAERVAACGSAWCITILLWMGLLYGGMAVLLYAAVHGVHLYYCGGGCCMAVCCSIWSTSVLLRRGLLYVWVHGRGPVWLYLVKERVRHELCIGSLRTRFKTVFPIKWHIKQNDSHGVKNK